MAGSVKWFVYTDNNSNIFALKADESNVEAVMGATGDYAAANSAIRYAMPSNLSPRMALYANADRTRTIKIPVLTAAAYNSLLADTPTITDPIGGTDDLNLIQQIPERVTTLPQAADTGLNDGDAT